MPHNALSWFPAYFWIRVSPFTRAKRVGRKSFLHDTENLHLERCRFSASFSLRNYCYSGYCALRKECVSSFLSGLYFRSFLSFIRRDIAATQDHYVLKMECGNGFLSGVWFLTIRIIYLLKNTATQTCVSVNHVKSLFVYSLFYLVLFLLFIHIIAIFISSFKKVKLVSSSDSYEEIRTKYYESILT